MFCLLTFCWYPESSITNLILINRYFELISEFELSIIHCIFVHIYMTDINVFDSLQVTEELEKVKMEMEDRGSSMTDGGKLQYIPFNHWNTT